MRAALLIAGREIRSYLGSPFGWGVLGVVCGIMGFLYFVTVWDFVSMSMSMQEGQLAPAWLDATAVFNQAFAPQLAFLYIFFVPLFTMRLLAEERKLATIELLVTAPISSWSVTIGKFLGGFGYLCMLLLLLSYAPLLLFVWGTPDAGVMGAGMLGLLLLGALSVSLGLLCSSVTENQILAGALTSVSLLSLWLVGFGAGAIAESIASSSPALEEILLFMSLPQRLENFYGGVLHTSDILFMLSLIFFCLFATQQRVESLRWR